VLFGSAFWNDVLNLDALVKWGVISPEDLDLIKIVDTVEEAHDYVVEKLTERFLS
jgi:predicted Rossmann-fold nucleotide-binding protein